MSEVLFDIFDATARFHTDGRMVPSPGRVVQVHADALMTVRAKVGPEAAWLLLEIALRAVVDPVTGKVVAETSAERLADELRTGVDRDHPGWSRKSVLNHLRALVEAGFVIREQTLHTDAGRAMRKSWSTTRLVLSDRLTAVPDATRTPLVGTAQQGTASAVPIRDPAAASAVPDRDAPDDSAALSAVPTRDGADTPPAGPPASAVPSTVIPNRASGALLGEGAGRSVVPARVGARRDDNNNDVDDEEIHHHDLTSPPSPDRRAASSAPHDPARLSAVIARMPGPVTGARTPGGDEERVWTAVVARARALGYTGSVAALRAHRPGRVLAWVVFLEENPKQNNGGFLRSVLREADTWPPGGPGPLDVALSPDGSGVHLIDGLGTWSPGQAGMPAQGPDAVTASATARPAGPVTTEAIFTAMEELDARNGGDPHPARAQVNARTAELMAAGLARADAFKRAACQTLHEHGVPGWVA